MNILRYLRIVKISILSPSSIQRVIDSAGELLGDKTYWAIRGMTPSDTQKAICYIESEIRKQSGIDDDVTGFEALEKQKPLGIGSITSILKALREQVRILALAYTKALSDLNAVKIQQSNSTNFVQSMGDPSEFAAFLRNNFRNDVLGRQDAKMLDVAQAVMIRLMTATGQHPDLSKPERPTPESGGIL